jgi:phenylalanyl-tRNA synthetase beta chain
MKFTLSWLKDYLDTDASLEDILDRLNMIGLEVEEVTNRADRLKPFKIAKVLEAEQHPNADRLRVLKVDTGDGEPVQVVCGAPNARAGLVGVLGKPGDYVPGLDVTLSVGKIRDVESFGMMCSERELELSDEHDRDHRSWPGCSGRRKLCRLGRAGRTCDRDRPDSEPSGLHRRLRHRP